MRDCSGHVEAVVDARLLRRQPIDGAEQAVGRSGVAAVGAGAAWQVGAADDGQLRVAVDDHAVVADALVGLRPVRRARRVDAGDVVDDDALPPLDLPITLSQKAPCVPFSNRPITVSTDSSSGSRSTSSVISSISRPSPLADQPDVSAPHHGRDRRQQHHRHSRPSTRRNRTTP